MFKGNIPRTFISYLKVVRLSKKQSKTIKKTNQNQNHVLYLLAVGLPVRLIQDTRFLDVHNVTVQKKISLLPSD